MGPFTNYVTHFLLFFDHPPTHSNALAIILLMTYNTRVCYSNTFANHPPTPAALRNMWTAPNIIYGWSFIIIHLFLGVDSSVINFIGQITTASESDIFWAVKVARKKIVETSDNQGAAFFPVFSLIRHSCSSNAKFLVYSNHCIAMQAQVHVHKLWSMSLKIDLK